MGLSGRAEIRNIQCESYSLDNLQASNPTSALNKFVTSQSCTY